MRKTIRILIVIWSVVIIGGDFPVCGSVDIYSLVRNVRGSGGLMQNEITAIVQDRCGYIWIGTEAGLLRYDGFLFTPAEREAASPLRNGRITDLRVDRKGVLWVGTEGAGMFRGEPSSPDFHIRAFRPASAPGFPAHIAVTVIYTGFNDAVWAGTRGHGVLHYINNVCRDRISVGGDRADDVIFCLTGDHRGHLWAGTPNGLIRLENSNGRWRGQLFGVRDGLPHHRILSLLHHPSGALLAGTASGLTAFRYSPGEPGSLKVLGSLLTEQPVYALRDDGNDGVYIGTSDGLRFLSFKETGEWPPVLVSFPQPELAGIPIISLFPGTEGVLWAGSRGRSLFILSPRRAWTVAAPAPTAPSDIACILKTADGGVWAGGNGGGLLYWKPQLTYTDSKTGPRPLPPADALSGEHRVYTAADGLRDNCIRTLAPVPGSGTDVWVGTASGLNLITNNEPTARYIDCGVENPDIRALLPLSPDSLWIGCHGQGLIHLNPQTGAVRQQADLSLPDGRFIRCLADAGNGRLWIGGAAGLRFFDGNAFSAPSAASPAPSGPIRQLLPGTDNDWWIAAENGLFHMKSGKTFLFSPDDPHLGVGVRGVMISKTGSLWCVSGKGAAVVSLAVLDQMERGMREHVDAGRFDRENGMVSEYCGEGQPACIFGPDGRPWLPTAAGIVVIDLPSGDTQKEFPNLRIETVEADGAVFDPSGPLILESGTRQIRIRFSILSYPAPEKIRHRRRLIGFDEQWREDSSSREAVYHNLPPGLYQFELTASNSAGAWSNTRKTLTFTVNAPFFHGFWFFFVVALLITGGAFWWYLLPALRQRRLEKQEKYQASNLTVLDIRSLSRRLTQAMEKDKLYLDPDLNAEKLAAILDVNQKNLSQAINQHMGLNFKNFINRYRIEEAKRKLLDPREKDYVVLKIAMDCGFNSKSVFNEAFKKFTGLSPTQYREMHKKE